VDAFMCYKQKCKVVSLNLAHPVVVVGIYQVCRCDGSRWLLLACLAAEQYKCACSDV